MTQKELSHWLGIVFIILLGFAGWYLLANFNDREIGESSYKWLSIDEDGSVVKDIAELSDASRSKLPKGFPGYFIFGEDAEVLQAGTWKNPSLNNATETWVAVSVSNKPLQLYQEYKEYFEAIKWKVLKDTENQGRYILLVKNGTRQVNIDIRPSNGGAILRIGQVIIPSSR